MRLNASDLQELANLAIGAATAAGEMIATARATSVDHKASGGSPASTVVTEIDRRSEAMIIEHLAPSLDQFELGLITEERVDDGSRHVADHFWCIDPLDGTLPFIEGLPGYAVSIALVARDGTPLVGVVHDPVGPTLWHAVAGGGAFRDRVRFRSESRSGDELSVFADRSFLAAPEYETVFGEIDRIARSQGFRGARLHVGAGAVMNACGVLDRSPACYLKFPASSGGGSVWDFAATACLFAEAGAVATDIHGDRLDLNRPDSTFMNHRGALFANDDRLAGPLRAMYRGRA